MSVILTLSIVLLILLAVIFKGKGVRIFCSLYINIFIMIFAVLFMALGVNPIILGLVFSLVFSIITLIFVNGLNNKTIASLISVCIVLLIMGCFCWWITIQSQISGFPLEHTDEISKFSFNVNIDYIRVTISIMLMGLVGTITDAALDAATITNELCKHNTSMSNLDLFKSGLTVGGDILGTMVNTLFFAFWGTFLGFFIWHQADSLGNILNYKAFSQEYIIIVISCLGCTLVIPLTIIVTILLLRKS